MIRWYSTGQYFDRLYTEEIATLERFEFDPVPAGAWLLGAHLRLLLDEEAAAALIQITDDGDLRGRLTRDMATVQASAMVEAMCEGTRGAGGL